MRITAEAEATGAHELLEELTWVSTRNTFTG